MTSFARIVLAAGLVGATAHAAQAAPTMFAGYYGEMVFHPGVFGGVEQPLVCSGRLSLHGVAIADAYVHVRNHVGVGLSAELSGRVALGRGVALELGVGLGYVHTFAGAPVYEVDDAGAVHRITDFGRPAVRPSVALAVSFALGATTPFVRVEGFGQYPFNDHLLPHAALMIGVRR
jgi:hypothetical protein